MALKISLIRNPHIFYSTTENLKNTQDIYLYIYIYILFSFKTYKWML